MADTKPSYRMAARYSTLAASDVTASLEVRRRTHPNATWRSLGRILGWSDATTAKYASGEADGKLPLAIDVTLELAGYNPAIWSRGMAESTQRWHAGRRPKLARMRVLSDAI